MPPSALDTIAATTPMRSCMAAARINEAGAFVQGMFRIAILPRATFTAGLLPRRGPGDAERSGFDQGTDVDSADFAGFTALVVTADMPVYGSSPRAARSPLRPSDDIRNVNLPGAPVARNAYDQTFSGSVTYPVCEKDLEWLVRRSPLDVIVKGV